MRSEIRLEPLYFDPEFDETKWREKFSRKLDKLMRTNNVKNSELAEAVGVSRTAIFNYRNGKKFPDVYVFVLICEALGCKPSVLLDKL